MGMIADVAHELKKLEQDKKTLRSFGFVIAIALSIIGGLIFFKGSVPENARIFWIIGGAFLTAGLLLPVVLKPIHKFWMGLAFVMGWFMSRLLLSLMYYLVVTPISLIMKWTKGDFINQEVNKAKDSYWDLREAEIPKAQYERLF